MSLDLFVKLEYESSTIILLVGIIYSRIATGQVFPIADYG